MDFTRLVSKQTDFSPLTNLGTSAVDFPVRSSSFCFITWLPLQLPDHPGVSAVSPVAQVAQLLELASTCWI
jgi:hypothetical protein